MLNNQWRRRCQHFIYFWDQCLTKVSNSPIFLVKRGSQASRIIAKLHKLLSMGKFVELDFFFFFQLLIVEKIKIKKGL